jgi:hypothetical protein
LKHSKASSFSEDFDRKWYQQVGSKIIITWLANIVSPHLIHLALSPLLFYLRKRKAKLAIIQKDMNQLFLGPSFDVTAKYAIALNTIFVTMFYCSGMPLLLFLGSFSLFSQYWSYKYLRKRRKSKENLFIFLIFFFSVLRYNSKPPAYDHTLNQSISRYLPLAAIMHLAIGTYAYGCENIFPIVSQLLIY